MPRSRGIWKISAPLGKTLTSAVPVNQPAEPDRDRLPVFAARSPTLTTVVADAEPDHDAEKDPARDPVDRAGGRRRTRSTNSRRVARITTPMITRAAASSPAVAENRW